MDPLSKKSLFTLVSQSRVGSLGTLHDGAPFVSMVITAPDPTFSVWFFHVTRLSAHTQDLLKDPRASLMLAFPDEPAKDPQQLARLTLVGKAIELEDGSLEEDSAKAIYLEKFPQMEEIVGQLGDFSFWAFRPTSARFVAGFARAFSLDADGLKRDIGEGSKA